MEKAQKPFFAGFLSALNTFAAYWIFFLDFFIIADIFGRFLFNHPIAGTPEFTSNSLAAITFLQIAHILRRGGHLRAVVVLDRLSPRKREAVNMISNLLGFFLFVLGIISILQPTIHSWKIWEYEGEGSIYVPVYPFKTIILAGSILMAIQFFLDLMQSVKLILNPLARKREAEDGPRYDWID